MLFRIKKKWTKCVSNLLKKFKIKVWQSLRRDVFYHDFSGCCHMCKQGPVFFAFSYSSFKICNFTLHPVSEKKTWVWFMSMVKTFCEYNIKRFFFSHDVWFNIIMHTFDIISFIYFYFSKYFSSTSLDG